MKLSSVTITGLHKVGVPKTYTFEDLTYLCGPNGSGKSTILQAVVLGLLGYIPGTNKTASAIFAHANGDEIKIDVELVKSSESDPEKISIHREFVKSGSKLLTSCKTRPEGYDMPKFVGNLELPILNFNEFLSLTANKQKELMTSVIPLDMEELDTKAYLSSIDGYTSQLALVLEEISSQVPTLKGIDDVKVLNGLLKNKQAELKSQDTRAVSTIQSLVFYDDYIGETDVESLQTAINKLMLQRDSALKREANLAQYASAQEKLEKLSNLSKSLDDDPSYIELQQSLSNLMSENEDNNKAIEEAKLAIAEYKAAYNQNLKIIESNGICPFIEYNCEKVESRISKLSQDNEVLKLQILEADNVIKSKQADIKANSSKLFQISREIDRLTSAYRTRDSLEAVLETMDISRETETVSSSELSLHLQQLNDDLVKAAANEKYNQLMEVLQKQKIELEAQISFLKTAVKDTGENGLQTELMLKPFEQVEANMQSILKKLSLESLGRVKFKLEAKANSFDFGLERDKFIGFDLLSSGEKCIFTLVFMYAVLQISNSNISFMLIDDLFDHLDESRFNLVSSKMQNLSKEVQIIVAGVNKPNYDDVKSIINVGGPDD